MNIETKVLILCVLCCVCVCARMCVGMCDLTSSSIERLMPDSLLSHVCVNANGGFLCGSMLRFCLVSLGLLGKLIPPLGIAVFGMMVMSL